MHLSLGLVTLGLYHLSSQPGSGLGLRRNEASSPDDALEANAIDRLAGRRE